MDRRLAVGQSLDHPDRRQRVQPRPDPAAPDEDPVVGPDLGPRAQKRLACLRGLGRQPRRHDVDQLAKAAVAVVEVAVDQVVTGEHPEPVVALAIARADDEIGAGEVGDRVRGDDRRPASLRARGPGAIPLGGLDHDRVVEIGDVAGVQPGQRVEQVRRQALGDDDVVVLDRGHEPRVVLRGGVDHLDAQVLHHACLRGRDGDLAARLGDHLGELHRADRGSRHPQADRLSADEQHPSHRDLPTRARSSAASR